VAPPPRPAAPYLGGLVRALLVVLPIEAALTAAYGIFALAPRRQIFADLAARPTDVTHDAAAQSDTINLVLFLAAGVATLVTCGLMVAWTLQVRHVATVPPATSGLPWRLVTAAGFVLVIVALGLHLDTDPGQIATGYILLGIGALVVAAAAVWAWPSVRRSGRAVATPTTTASPPPSPWAAAP
jgi:hypothetical protein